MDKRTIILVSSLFAVQANAAPVEALGSMVAKLFKSGATKESAVAGRSVEGLAAKGAEHATSISGVPRPATQLVEPKPDMAADVLAKNRKDADVYKALRVSASNGDASAMLKMSEMIASDRVSDLGEPWRGYWLFQSARIGSQAAIRKANEECARGDVRRMTDKWFDSACGSTDGRTLYVSNALPATYSPYRTDLLMKPSGQYGGKQ